MSLITQPKPPTPKGARVVRGVYQEHTTTEYARAQKSEAMREYRRLLKASGINWRKAKR